MKITALSLAIVFAMGSLSGWAPKTNGLDARGLTVMAHYCPWYHPVDGKWDDGITGTPSLGFYESDDQGIVSQHIEWAEEYGLSGFIVEWTGLKAQNFDDTLKLMLANPDFAKVKFSLVYAVSMALGTVWEQSAGGIPPSECNWTVDCSDPGVRATFLADIEYAAENYFRRDNFLKVRGRPAFYMWATSALAGDVVGMLGEARASVAQKYGVDMYFIGEEVGWDSVPNPSRLRAFDAVMPYAMIDGSVPHDGAYPLGASLDSIIAQYGGWINVCKDLGMDFIPGVLPGYDDKNRTAYYAEIGGVIDTPAPIVTRSPSSFRDFCHRARELVDPDVGMIFVTSWNEWFEGTTVEPSTGYGFDYLDVIKEAFSDYEPTSGLPRDRIVFTFNEVVKPMDAFPGSSDARYLAVAFDYLEFLDRDGDVVGTIDIGTEGARRYMGLGWSGDEGQWDAVEDFVWAGGEDKFATVYVTIPEGAMYLKIHALPILDNVSMAISVGGNPIANVDLEDGWNEYAVGIGAAEISLVLSESSIAFSSSVILSGTVVPAASVPVTLEYAAHGSEWEVIATVASGADGTYSYVWTLPIGTHALRASCGSDANHAGAVSMAATLIVTKAQSAITCVVSDQRIALGESITISGTLNPNLQGATIYLTFTRPLGQTIPATAETGADGSYAFEFIPEEDGNWMVSARWPGDENYFESTSPSADFYVERPFPTLYVLLGLLAISPIAIWLLLTRAKRKSNGT